MSFHSLQSAKNFLCSLPTCLVKATGVKARWQAFWRANRNRVRQFFATCSVSSRLQRRRAKPGTPLAQCEKKYSPSLEAEVLPTLSCRKAAIRFEHAQLHAEMPGPAF